MLSGLACDDVTVEPVPASSALQFGTGCDTQYSPTFVSVESGLMTIEGVLTVWQILTLCVRGNVGHSRACTDCSNYSFLVLTALL